MAPPGTPRYPRYPHTPKWTPVAGATVPPWIGHRGIQESSPDRGGSREAGTGLTLLRSCGTIPRMRAHRKRLRRIESPGHVRYLTFSCVRRLPLLSNDAIKTLFVERLTAAQKQHHFELYAWVVMPEHVHLLLRPDLPDHPVPALLQSLKQSVAQRVIDRWRELRAPILPRITDERGRVRFWQPGGGYDRNIISDDELDEKVAYIHDNPRRRGLVQRAADYPWSSIHWYRGNRSGPLVIAPLPR